jgi:hypothetical protein
VAVLIHAGSPHDSKLFPEVVNDLEHRKVLRARDTVICDKRYSSSVHLGGHGNASRFLIGRSLICCVRRVHATQVDEQNLQGFLEWGMVVILSSYFDLRP